MSKTRRDLFLAIADLVGGERGKRMREALENCLFSHLDRPISDEEFALRLKQAEGDLPSILAEKDVPGRESPGTWGFPN